MVPTDYASSPRFFGLDFGGQVIPLRDVADVLETLHRSIESLWLSELRASNVACSTEMLVDRAFVQAQVQAFRAHNLLLRNGTAVKPPLDYASHIDRTISLVNGLLQDGKSAAYSSEYSTAYAREPDIAHAMVRLAVTTTFTVIFPFYVVPS